MPRPVHFEIHADDVDRARSFYEAVFGWQFTKWENPAFDYWLISTGDSDNPGIDGGLMKRQGPRPEPKQPVSSFVNTIDVPDIDDFIQKVKDAGGMIVVEKMAVPTVGWIAYVHDPEGNLFGMMEEDESAR